MYYVFMLWITIILFLFSERTDNYQLDTDYIQRYLGELTVMQESRLVQLRKWVSDLQKGKVINNVIMFLYR